MAAGIHRGAYKDRKAVYIENDTFIACFLPEDGGKMACLTNKKTGRELLVQACGEDYLPLSYGGIYVDAECSGFDDLFPTVDGGFYELPPWRGMEMPDHGEVCGLPWEYSIGRYALKMQTHGVRFPYVLSKTVSFRKEALRIDYCAHNPSIYDLDFIWVAHLMLNAEEGGTILVPYSNDAEISCVYSEDCGFALYGDILPWPDCSGRDGKPRRLGSTGAVNPQGNNYKYYFRERIPEGWCGYRYPDSTVLKIAFDKTLVPYLGIWANEGSFKGYHSVALEPCTGIYDRPDRARLHGQHSVLPAGGEYAWSLTFTLE